MSKMCVCAAPRVHTPTQAVRLLQPGDYLLHGCLRECLHVQIRLQLQLDLGEQSNVFCPELGSARAHSINVAASGAREAIPVSSVVGHGHTQRCEEDVRRETSKRSKIGFRFQTRGNQALWKNR